MSDSKVLAFLKGLGYDPGMGPMGAVTVPTSDTVPRTIPLAPGFPGVVMRPQDRPLTPEERAHEGVHVGLGLPGALAGKLGGMMLGTGTMGARIDPDEALAYMAQPNSPETSGDMKVQESQGGTQGGSYGKLLQVLAALRRAHAQVP